MNKNIETPKETESFEFPEESSQIVAQLLEKYGLQKAQEEGVKKFVELIESRIPKGRNEIFENLPGTKISQLIREYAEGGLILEKLPNLLKEKLAIPEKEAQKLANDLEGKLLNQIKPAAPAPPPEKMEHPQKPDTYREPVE